MLFNSYIFILGFLPVVFFGFFYIGKYSHNLACLWLAAASVFFYGWWNLHFVGLLLASILFNYGAGYLIGRGSLRGSASRSKALLAGAVAGNLLLLGYFKYANFFVANLNGLGAGLPVLDVVLPLGISFFSFTQIAFLVDTYQGKVKEYNFVHYTLFVTYFPHLIAGPVLHHQEMMPQFARRKVCQLNWDNVALGLSIFVLGLAKKLLIADYAGEFASPIFNSLAEGAEPKLWESWVAALTYSLQLYFDFSAYSDMAIGLSLLFNVRLPMNFNSPYKARNIINFWRRWHMTLSRFLRDYLYIPLGGNRHGSVQRYVNLMLTMLLGGLWHGAGWTFIVWGGLHGFYLMLNHGWRALKIRMGWSKGGRWANLGSGALTFLAVVVGWVFFRADSFASAITLLQGMLGFHGVSLPSFLAAPLGKYFAGDDWLVFDRLLQTPLIRNRNALGILSIGFTVAWGLPNVRELFINYKPTCDHEGQATGQDRSLWLRWFAWKPTTWQGAWYGALFFLLMAYMATAVKAEFLYFQF